MFETFHFLRPLWLVALPIAALVVFALLRLGDPRHGWRGVIDPHLLDALLVRGEQRRRPGPVHLLALGWLVGILALAGPAWRYEPSPFAEDSAALVIVMQTTDSMSATDVQPSRIERAAQKVADLLTLRPDADCALFAYAASTHRVMPLTRDAEVIGYFASALGPEIMPSLATGSGTDTAAEAISRANEELRRAGRAGSIILLSDGVAPDQVDAIAQTDSVPVHVLAVVTAGTDTSSLQSVASTTGGTLVRLTPDDADVQRLGQEAERRIGAGSDENSASFVDDGYWLTPILALLVLFWSRRGWVVPVPEKGS